jgi:hypothetical protein
MGRSWDRWVEMGRTLDDLIGRIVTRANGTPSTPTTPGTPSTPTTPER